MIEKMRSAQKVLNSIGQENIPAATAKLKAAALGQILRHRDARAHDQVRAGRTAAAVVVLRPSNKSSSIGGGRCIAPTSPMLDDVWHIMPKSGL